MLRADDRQHCPGGVGLCPSLALPLQAVEAEASYFSCLGLRFAMYEDKSDPHNL